MVGQMISQVETLCRQHDALRGVVADYATQLARDEPDLAALSACRWTLTRLVTMHLAYEDRHLYSALPACGEHAAALGERMNAEHGTLSRDYMAHVREWTASAIMDDWAGFRRDASGLLSVLSKRMDREEKELYPLLLVKSA